MTIFEQAEKDLQTAFKAGYPTKTIFLCTGCNVIIGDDDQQALIEDAEDGELGCPNCGASFPDELQAALILSE